MLMLVMMQCGYPDSKRRLSALEALLRSAGVLKQEMMMPEKKLKKRDAATDGDGNSDHLDDLTAHAHAETYGDVCESDDAPAPAPASASASSSSSLAILQSKALLKRLRLLTNALRSDANDDARDDARDDDIDHDVDDRLSV